MELMTERPSDSMVQPWWVLHTRSRHEKALAMNLERCGIENYLPLAKVKRLHGGRPVMTEIPLFPGYLFMKGNVEARYRALRTQHVAQVISVPDQNQLQKEMERIQQIVASAQPVDLSPRICFGRRVRVIKGILKGLEGVVVRRRDSCRVHVAVSVLSQAAEVEIDASSLELIEDERVSA